MGQYRAVRIDLHVHTNRYSTCSIVSPEEIVHEAIAAGSDGLVFTDHETFWEPDELQEIQQQFPEITLFNGAEIDVPSLQHVITILPEPEPGLIDPSSPEGFIDRVDQLGGVMIAAHQLKSLREASEVKL